MAPERNNCGSAADCPISDMDAFKRAIAEAVAQGVKEAVPTIAPQVAAAMQASLVQQVHATIGGGVFALVKRGLWIAVLVMVALAMGFSPAWVMKLAGSAS